MNKRKVKGQVEQVEPIGTEPKPGRPDSSKVYQAYGGGTSIETATEAFERKWKRSPGFVFAFKKIVMAGPVTEDELETRSSK